MIKNCRKWIADGKPPKPNKPESTNSSDKSSTNMTLLIITSVVTPVDCDNDGWYVDNGATSHVTNNNGYFKTFEPFSTKHTVTTANGNIVKAIGKGAIDVEAAVNEKWYKLTLEDVWYVPKIQKNLFSVLTAQGKNPKNKFTSTVNVCHLKIDQDVKLIGIRNRFGGLFKLLMRYIKSYYPTEVNMINKDNLLQLYHEKFGHQNKRHVKAMIEKELQINVGLDTELCEECIYGKAHRLPFGTKKRAMKPGELIHTDVCGPFQNSMSGYHYFVLFKNNYTKFRVIDFIKEKSEVADKLKQFLAETKTAGHVVKELLSDNGGEFDNKQVKEILQHEGIIQRLTMPYTPQQNGCSERQNRTVVETARAIMHAHGNIAQNLWAEMINSASYIVNRTRPSNISGISSYELWYNKKPGTKHLRIIGSTCYAHIPKQQRRKMDQKAVKGIPIGYDHDEGYRILNEENNLIRSRDVIFEEKTLIQKKRVNIPVNMDVPDQECQDSEPQTEEQSETDTQSTEEDFESTEDFEEEETLIVRDIELAKEPENNLLKNIKTSGRQLRDRSTIKHPEKFKDFVAYVSTDFKEPETYKEAIRLDEQDEWREAMDALQENLDFGRFTFWKKSHTL